MGITREPTFSGVMARSFLVPARRLGQTLSGYNGSALRSDLLAGLTVSVVSIPQSMAYAIVAGVDPRYGLYAVIFQSLIASAFNSVPLLSVGPNNTQALLVAGIVTRIVSPANTNLYLEMVIGMTLVKGLFQLALSAGRMGNLVRYVSRSVIVGFTAGAGVLIAVGQIHSLLGFSVQRAAGNWPGIVGDLQRLIPHVTQMSLISLALGVGTVVIVLIARRMSRLAPGPLIAIIATAAAVYGFGWTDHDFSLMGALPRALAWPAVPHLETAHIQPILTGGLALALLGLMEVYAIDKALTSRRGGRISANQDLFSQGLMHVASSFLWCMPGSGSFARSALNEYAGAKTFLSGIFNGLFVLAIFFIFAPAAQYIPLACIAGILFVVAYGLIDWRYLLRAVASDRSDALVCGITFLATLLAPLTYAVFIGIFLNIAVYLRKASHLHIAEMVRTPEGPFLERPVSIRDEEAGPGIRDQSEKRVIFLQIEGDLFFAQADELEDRLNALVGSEVRVVILRLKRTHSVDATAMTVLEHFVESMHALHKHVLLCGVRPEMLEHLENFGLTKKLGKRNVFSASYGVFTSAKQALARAKELIGASIDVEGLKGEDELEGWSYQI